MNPAHNVEAYLQSLRELNDKLPPGKLAAAVHKVLTSTQRELFFDPGEPPAHLELPHLPPISQDKNVHPEDFD